MSLSVLMAFWSLIFPENCTCEGCACLGEKRKTRRVCLQFCPGRCFLYRFLKILFGYPVIVSCNVMATFALALTAVSVGCSLVLNRIKSTNFHHDRVQEHVICATLEQSVSHWTSSTSGNRNLTHPDELPAFWAYLNWAYFSKQSTNFVTYDVFIWIILKQYFRSEK